MDNERGREPTAAADTGVPLDRIPVYSAVLFTLLDEDGAIHYESPAIERMYGYDQAELVGEQVADYVHPADRADVLDAFRTVVSSEAGGVEAIEYRHKQADGTYRWVESVASTNSTPEGQYVVNTREISERRQQETQLERFRKTVEATAHAVFITNPDGTIEYVNRAFTLVTGYEREEAIGRTPRILKSGEMSGEYYEKLWETILTGDVWDEEIINRRKSGELYHAAQTISPITDDGEVSAFVAVQADITDRKEREQTLRRQNERLEQFASVISHDLRNPLNVAELRLDLAAETCDSEHLDDVNRALDRMDALITNLLALARAGQRIEDIQETALSEVVRRSWHGVDTADAEITIETERTVVADPDRLQQLFENLFRNAVEHGGRDVTITVDTWTDGFYIEDDGPGISADDHDDVFEVGYSSTDGGTGLGLSIVKEIVDGHGWNIAVLDGETGGTRFEITNVETRQ